MGLRGPPVAGPDGEDVDTTKQLDHIWRSHCLVGFIVLVFGAVLAITVGWAVSTLEEQQWESDFDNTASALISSMSKVGDESVGHMHLVSAAIRGATINRDAGGASHIPEVKEAARPNNDAADVDFDDDDALDSLDLGN